MEHVTFSRLLLYLLLLHNVLLSVHPDAQLRASPGVTVQSTTGWSSKGSRIAPVLLPSEVDALNNITIALQRSQRGSYDEYSCGNSDSSQGITCDCNATSICRRDCNATSICHVTELSFPYQDYTGEISSAIGELEYLIKLDLSRNKISGIIPTTIANLNRLEILDLSYNQLKGPIPDIFSKMEGLNLINLNFNFLEGHIPPSLGVLKNLTRLDLTANQLTGPIPKQLKNMTSIINLHLGDNQLTGTLPSELGKWESLTSIQLSGNYFTGELPALENLTLLQVFTVRGNNFVGEVPTYIANWTLLKTLDLMGNSFRGSLPAEIFQLQRLSQLWVADVRVNGNSSFPPLSNMKAIESIILRNCSIAGQIPQYVGNMNLIELDLSFNNLSGVIPPGLQNLKYLGLTRNNFSGSIPDWANKSGFVDVSYNNFSNNSTWPYFKSSNVNNFTPAALPRESSAQIAHVNCPYGKHYSLYINCGGSRTTLDGNDYEEDSSNLPFYVSPDQRWAYSSSGDFMSPSLGPQNNTYGISVPDAPLYATARLSPLALDYYGLCLLDGLYTVTLHFAEIVFSAKDDHSILGTRVFDIFIQGEIVAKDFNIKAEAHGPNERVSKRFRVSVNDSSLNIHLYWAGKGSGYVKPQLYGPLISAISVTPEFKIPTKTKTAISVRAIAAITVGSVVLPLLILAILWKSGCFGHKEFAELEGAALQERKLTFQDIVKATQDFSPAMEIGRGGSGTVYKAVLQDGSALAVKKIQSRSISGLGEYINEVRTLESLKDENLVQLLGWYTGGDQLLLIYEYMEKNSLQNAFFDTKLEFFSWETRFRICLQIAKGLVYLHKNAEPKIIHRDIKPSNILLDGILNAKISDFGLARFYHEEQGAILTKLCGTHGYMAPEYALRGILTEKTDVYSYGVVILEVITGRSNATYNSNQECEFLLDEAYVLEKEGNPLDLIDATVKNKAGYNVKQASKLLTLAMMCTNQSPTLRPTMSDVVSVLEGVKTIQELSASNQTKLANDSKHSITTGGSISAESDNTSSDGMSTVS